MNKKIFSLAILTAVFCLAGTASATTESERQAAIKLITSKIAQLQAQLSQMQSAIFAANQANEPSDSRWCHDFSEILSIDDSSPEVSALQTVLIKEGLLTAITKPTGYFYKNTYNAIIAFQRKYGISTTGRVGPNTNAKLTELYGCSNSRNSSSNTALDGNSNNNSNISNTTDNTTNQTSESTVSSASNPSGSASGALGHGQSCNSDSDCQSGLICIYCSGAYLPGVTSKQCHYPSESQSCASVPSAQTHSSDSSGSGNNTSSQTQPGYTVPPLVDIWANNSNGPVSIITGSAVNLGWTAGGADSCQASGSWSGTQPVNGTQTIQSLTSSATYTITCSNNAGSRSDSVTVNVYPAPTVDIKANNTESAITINSGDSVTLSWTTTNATSCVAGNGLDPDWSGSVPTSGSKTINNITTQKTYSISCTGQGGFILPNGVANGNVTVNMAGKPNCTPSWSCQWSPCTNGFHRKQPVDANNCGIPASQSGLICPSFIVSCTTSENTILDSIAASLAQIAESLKYLIVSK